MRERLAARVRALFHLDGPPWRIALALALGVFISFTPFYGVQTVLALLTAAALRLNAAALVTGTWINLPWFAPFVYAGALALGERLLPDLRGLAGVSAWLLVGTSILGAVAALVTYVVALGMIRVRHARRRGGGRPPDAPEHRAA